VRSENHSDCFNPTAQLQLNLNTPAKTLMVGVQDILVVNRQETHMYTVLTQMAQNHGFMGVCILNLAE